MAFESTNAILNINESERAKKNDRWKKLMDIASLGTDIWGTLSGRKYSTSERIGGEQADLNRLSMTHLYNMDELKTKLEQDKNFQLFKNQNPGKSDEELKAGFLMSDAGQAYLKRMDEIDAATGLREHGWRMSEIEAGKGATASQERITRMRQAITDGFKASQLKSEWWVPDPRDPSGETLMINPVTIDALRQNIMLAVLMERPTKEELAAVTPYLEDLLSGKTESSDITNKGNPQLAQQVASRLSELAIAGKQYITPRDTLRLNETVPVSNRPGEKSEPGWFGAERDLEAGLQGVIPQLQDPIDKALAESMLIDSQKKTKLSPETYVKYLASLRALLAKLGKLAPTQPQPQSIRDQTRGSGY